MRILLTTDTVGGVWTFTQELCAGLLERGHSVALVSLGRAPSAAQAAWCGEMNAWYGARLRYRSLDTPLEWMEKNALAYRDAEAKLLQVAAEFKPDLLHANQFCFGALPVKMPKLITAHSDVISWGEACHPEGLEETAWLRTYRELVERGLDGADAVAAPTEWMANALRRGFHYAGPVRVIANGRSIAGGADPNPMRKLQAVSVGRRWDQAKGFSVLEGLNAAMPVVVAGETKFDGVVQAEGLGERQIVALLQESSVYLATSIYEPFGLAPLEAALCGCAVVANDIPSLREVWGDAAIYFRGQDELKACLERLVVSGSVLRCAQLRSHARALELSSSAMVDRYLEIYRTLIARAEPRRPKERMAYAS